MLNTFSGKDGTSLCCSENEEVNQFTIDYRNIEFEVSGIKMEDILEGNHGQLEGGNNGKGS